MFSVKARTILTGYGVGGLVRDGVGVAVGGLVRDGVGVKVGDFVSVWLGVAVIAVPYTASALVGVNFASLEASIVMAFVIVQPSLKSTGT